jgi:hypothetical protein
MGKGVDMNSGEYYFMNTFVAGKPTSIQVVLSDTESIGQDDYVNIYKENVLLTTVYPDKTGERQLLTFTPSRSAVGGWVAGRYKFEATINGSTKTTEAIFNDSKSFSILVIGGETVYDGGNYEAPVMDSNAITLRAQALPISDDKLIRKFRAAPVSFGVGENGYDLSTSEGQSRILRDIEEYRLKSAAKYDVIVCLVNSPLTIGGNASGGKTTGYTNCNHAVVITLDGNPGAAELESTLLHELGHIFGNGDEYTGGSAKINVNGLPYGVSATDSNGNAVTGSRSWLEGVDGNAYSGILNDDEQNPFNAKTGANMRNTSSCMGSSYTHWTTSMVWETAYKALVPNYNNVLPKVYTDGSIVAKLPTHNELSNDDIEALRDQWISMVNEVKTNVFQLPEIPNDAVYQAGNKFLQAQLEDAYARGEMKVSGEELRTNIMGATKTFIGQYTYETYIYEYTPDELEYFRGFFSESSCGNAWIGQDYMSVAFIRSENKTYYVWMTFSDVSPAEPDEEVPAQPEIAPVPEVNPVTDQPVSPNDYVEPVGYDGDRPGVQPSGNDGTQNGGDNSGTYDDGTQNGGNGDGTNNTEYAALTEAQRLVFFGWDVFDYSMAGAGMKDQTKEYWNGFIAWYTNDQFATNLTAADVNQYMIDADDAGYMEQNFAALGLYEYLKLFPTYEMRMVYGYDGNPSEFYITEGDFSQWTQSPYDPDSMKKFVDENQDGYDDNSPYDSGAPVVSDDGWDDDWSDGDFDDPDGDW